jgi:hypothetical protein
VGEAGRGVAGERQRLRIALADLEQGIEQGNRNLALLPADLLDGVIATVRAAKERQADLARELARLDAIADVQTDYSRHGTAALEQLGNLSERIKHASPESVRNAFAGLVEKITLFSDYGPVSRKGTCRASLTSLEVGMREEAAWLLGDNLLRSAHSTGQLPRIVLRASDALPS